MGSGDQAVNSPPQEVLKLSDLDRVIHTVAMAVTEESQVKSIARLSDLTDPPVPSGTTRSVDRWEPVFQAALVASPETLAKLLKNIRRSIGDQPKSQLDYALLELRVSCVSRVTRTAHLSLSDQIDDLSQASPPEKMTESAQRLRRTALSMRRLLMRPLLAEMFLQMEQHLELEYEEPERLRLELANQAVNVVTALDYLLTLLFTPAVTSSQLVLSGDSSDRTQGRTDEEAYDWLTRRRFDARNTAIRESMRLLVMLRRDIAFD